MEKLSPGYFRFQEISTESFLTSVWSCFRLGCETFAESLKKTTQPNKPQHPPSNLHFIIEHSPYRLNKLFMEKAILLLDPGVLGSLHVKDLTLHNQSSRITVILYLTQIA